MKLTDIQADQKKILKLFRKHDVVLLGGSTGYGKTVLSWSLIEDWVKQKKRILVLTHGRKEIRENFSASKPLKLNFLYHQKSHGLEGQRKLFCSCQSSANNLSETRSPQGESKNLTS
jgi:NAD dependent epimerase/dehydratase family enzyme